MPSDKAMKAAKSYLQWMIRTPVISRDKPQEVKLAEAFDQHAAEAVEEHRTVVLGEGDTVVSDIHNRDKKWAGICFTKQNSSVGEYTDIDSDTDEGAFLRIVTENPDSIDVLIEALRRAKAYLHILEWEQEKED